MFCISRSFARHGRAFDEDRRVGLVHLRVGVDRHDGRVVVGHDDRLLLRSVGRGGRDVGHQAHQVGLDLVHVDVAHDDDHLIVGTVPRVVEVREVVVREALQTVEVADDVAVFVLRAFGQRLDHGLLRAEARAVAGAELLHDYAALRIDLGRFECDEVRPVVQHEQCRVDDALARGGHVGDRVLGVVLRGVGVEVAAELHADALEVVDHLLAAQVLRAVEGHVLQEVGQTLLGVVLLNGAHVVFDVEIGLSLGFLVVADVVVHAVGELAVAHGRVGRHRLHGVDLRPGSCDEEEGGDRCQ